MFTVKFGENPIIRHSVPVQILRDRQLQLPHVENRRIHAAISDKFYQNITCSQVPKGSVLDFMGTKRYTP